MANQPETRSWKETGVGWWRSGAKVYAPPSSVPTFIAADEGQAQRAVTALDLIQGADMDRMEELRQRLADAERERDHWKANHDAQVKSKRDGHEIQKAHYEILLNAALEASSIAEAARLEAERKLAALEGVAALANDSLTYLRDLRRHRIKSNYVTGCGYGLDDLLARYDALTPSVLPGEGDGE